MMLYGGIMSDAATNGTCIQEDAETPFRLPAAALQMVRDAKARLKLADTAVQHGMRRFDARSVDDLGVKLGYTRLAFYRLRTGRDCRISLVEAATLAQKLGLPFTRTFERV